MYNLNHPIVENTNVKISRTLYHGNGSVQITGIVDNLKPGNVLIFRAANPPDYRQSFSGSALPYPNEEFAMENTPNQGQIVVNPAGTFSVAFRYPNAYYTNLGTTYVKPHVLFQVVHASSGEVVDKIDVVLDQGIPFRTLNFVPDRNSASFYERSFLKPRTQEGILYDCSYPLSNIMPSNFWGACPSHP